jgi:hypothetical protein
LLQLVGETWNHIFEHMTAFGYEVNNVFCNFRTFFEIVAAMEDSLVERVAAFKFESSVET